MDFSSAYRLHQHSDSIGETIIPESAATCESAATPIVPIILSGGGGSRLWPFSTSETPKQFIPFVKGRSLYQEALGRVRDRASFASPIVVANARHAELCERELAGAGDEPRVILEPCARNTAAAVIMAAGLVRQMHGANALLLVMPSDHLIEDVESFHAAVSRGEAAARQGRLVTFGIQPTAPDTGYGYLEMGPQVGAVEGVMEVARFVEKPAIEAAEQMVADGRHLWNAGIFLFSAQTLIDEMMMHAPEIGEAALEAVRGATSDGIRVNADLSALTRCPSESIDYALMERSQAVAVVPMAPGWSDLGSWDALASLVGETPSGPITTLDCESCYIRSDGVEVAALGVRDLIIVASGQRLLILPRGRSQEVKKLLSVMDSMAA
jgi:mannose-1-phosphate guanylyltransferase/mannose-1-phosphate guanylyltransferase/mannose-6-phosphate isomerase